MPDDSRTIIQIASDRHGLLADLTGLAWSLHRLGLDHHPVAPRVDALVDAFAEQPTWPPLQLALIEHAEQLMVDVDTIVTSPGYQPLDQKALTAATVLSERILDRVGPLHELALLATNEYGAAAADWRAAA